MNEVKKPKKPLIFYYAIVLLILLIFNFLGMPLIAEHSVQEVNYNTFVEIAANGEIGSVEIQAQENRILFTNKDGTAIYKTGMVDDPELAALAGLRRTVQRRNHRTGLAFPDHPAHLGSAHPGVYLAWTVYVQKADGKGGRPKQPCLRNGQIKCKSIRQVLRGHQVFGRCRRGRGQGGPCRSCGLSA